MTRFNRSTFLRNILGYAPIILLFISVLNEIDFNYSKLKYFSFNFPFILIFYWSLKKSERLGYGLIFFAGLINDVVLGFPLGISSFSYLLICGFAAYLKNITLRPNKLNDCLFFLLTILVVNALMYFLLFLFFDINWNYISLITNIVFTFLLYIIFSFIFDLYNRIIFGKMND